MKTLKEITGDSLEQMIDYKVVDQNGDSIGTLHSLWSDPTTGTVEFLGVKTGWIFGQNHVVPAEKAELDETQNVVRLPYTSTFVKEAPSMSAEAEISEEEENTIYHYYGLARSGVPESGTMPAPDDSHLDKLPEAPGASSLAAASGRDEGSSNFGAPTSGMAGDVGGASRLRRTVRTETAGTEEDQSRVTSPQTHTPTAGEAVRGALDDLMPGDSSSTSTISRSAATPGSYGTTNLYGSTGTSTPVAADATGTAFDTAASTTTSGASMAGPDDDTRPAAVGAANPDVVTGEPGSHPVGVGTGGFAGGAAGAAIGAAVGGPVGAVVGGIAGVVGGGYAGKGIAESINPTEENAYWENNYRSASYYENGYGYEDYSPAYRTGYEGFGRHAAAGKDYADVESDLERDYNSNRGSSRLEWDKAKVATRDAWDRLKGKFSDATR